MSTLIRDSRTSVGLLDLVTGAIFAYSACRKLFANYNSPLMRVFRQSDSVEKDIYADNKGNLNQNDINNFLGANTGSVSIWNDQCSAYNATQSTMANQPFISASGSIYTVNNKPALFFNAAQWFLNDCTLSQPCTIYIVSRVNNSSADFYYLHDGRDATPFRVAAYLSGGNYNMFAGIGLGTTTGINAQLLSKHTYNGASSSLWFNGTEYNAGDTGAENATKGMTIGARFNSVEALLGYMQEFIVFPRVLTATEQSIIQKDINSYYSIY